MRMDGILSAKASWSGAVSRAMLVAMALAAGNCLTSPVMAAATIDGDGLAETVGPTYPVLDWIVLNGARLYINGGAATTVSVGQRGYLEMNGGTVSAGSNAPALSFNTVDDAANAAIGVVNDSTITGAMGIVVGDFANVSVTGSTVTGLGQAGIVLRSLGTITVTNSTILSEGHDAITIRGSDVSGDTLLVLDNSTVESKAGSAILVDGQGMSLDAVITVANGSTLTGANGVVLSAGAGANVIFTVDNSALTGNIVVAGDTSNLITLKNKASLTGQMTGVQNLVANSGGTWNMIDNAGVTNLSMNGGIVNLSDGSGAAFHTLTLASLSGSGTFGIGTNLQAQQGDMLVIIGANAANGTHSLHVMNSGGEPGDANQLTVVQTNGGDAQFSVVGGSVDLGVFKYHLVQEGNDWMLVGSPIPGEPEAELPGTPENPIDPEDDIADELSPSAHTVIALHDAAANVYATETQILRQRMGDVRLGKGQNGVWGRTYGREGDGGAAGGVHYDQTTWGLQAGAEREVELGGIALNLGAFGGYSRSDLTLDGGSKGEIGSGYGGLYATWLGADGLYVDGLFKFNRFSNQANIVMSDGTSASGDYNSTGFGGQVELGKHFALAKGWYVEPFAQIAALHIGSFDYRVNNGMVIDSDAYNSLQGRIGATLGFNHQLASGAILQPYLRAAVAREFIDGNDFTINDLAFSNGFKGTRGEVGGGFVYQFNDKVQIHADMDYQHGRLGNKNWGGNFGLTVKF